MVHGLLEKLLQKGLSLHANTPVTSVSSAQDSQGRWTVNTPRGSIKTAKVVYATNGYTSGILPEYNNLIVPVRGIACHIESPKGKHAPHLVNTYGIRFDSRSFDYLIPRADGSIVVGGAKQMFWHNRDRWFGNLRDDELVDEAVLYFDGYMQRHFRGWEGSKAEVKQVWTGSKYLLYRFPGYLPTDTLVVMGYSSDFMPHIGAIPQKPGQFIIAGFSGHGMPQILLSSKAVAAMVRDGVPFEKVGLPHIFKTTAERLARESSPLEESLRPLWETKPKAKF